MKKLITSIVFILAATSLFAQDAEGWTKNGVAGVNMSQASFSNWSAGGDNSIAFDANFNYDLNYKKDKHLWTNRLELAYGLNKTKSYPSTRKTNDKIYLSSNYGFKVAEELYIGALLTFNTQFSKGYDYGKTPNADHRSEYISTFMAPGYLTTGVGLIWTPKPWFKLTFNPASWRGTFVEDDMLSDAGSFGVDPGKRFLNQFGANLVGEINTPIWENIKLYSRLELYSNYLKNPENVVLHWDVQLNMKINKWLSAGLTTNMIYDDNIKFVKENDPARKVAKLQFKQTLGVGFQVQF